MIQTERASIVESLLILTAMVHHAAGEIIWDNRGPRGWGSNLMASGRATDIPDTWAADDFLLLSSGVIEKINAVMFVRPYEAPIIAADFLVMDAQFEVIFSGIDLAFEHKMLWCCDFGGGAYYRINIPVDQLHLPAGRYYCAVRLVSTGPDCGCRFGLSATDASIQGETEGYFQDPAFGYPDWTALSEVFEDPFDFNFWLEGELDEPDCGAIKRARARTNCKRSNVIAKVKTTLPEGTQLGMTLDGGRPQGVTLDDRGRAKTRWDNATGGEVCIGGCEEPCATAPGCG